MEDLSPKHGYHALAPEQLCHFTIQSKKDPQRDSKEILGRISADLGITLHAIFIEGSEYQFHHFAHLGDDEHEILPPPDTYVRALQQFERSTKGVMTQQEQSAMPILRAIMDIPQKNHDVARNTSAEVRKIIGPMPIAAGVRVRATTQGKISVQPSMLLTLTRMNAKMIFPAAAALDVQHFFVQDLENAKSHKFVRHDAKKKLIVA